MTHNHNTQERFAHERTVLANQRTMLAEFRTGIAFLGAGVGFFKLFPNLGPLTLIVSIGLGGVGVFFLITGIVYYPSRSRMLRELKQVIGRTDELHDDLLAGTENNSKDQRSQQ